MKIFVAFDSGDQATAAILVTILREWFRDGLDITFSPEFEFGKDWRRQLDQAIRDGDALLAVCTPRAVTNRWIHFEAGAFHGRGKHVIPVTLDGLTPSELPEPLNTFQAPNLQVANDVEKFAQQIASMATGLKPPNRDEARAAVARLRAGDSTGLRDTETERVQELLSDWKLRPNARATAVLRSTRAPYRFAFDDLIVLYASPGWAGLQRKDVRTEIGGRRRYDREVTRRAQEYQRTRPDKDDNKGKLALVALDPFMTDRDHLRLQFEEMLYFDFEGPRRALFVDDTPTQFAQEFYLGRDIPEAIPTPLACVHTIVLTRDGERVVLGLRRRAAKPDFYDNRISVGFEEQMSPEDSDLFTTVKRGVKQEIGLTAVADDQIELLAVGLEASFFSIAPIAVVRLEASAEEIHDSIQTRAVDHEWDPLFVRNELAHLRGLLGERIPRWEQLEAQHWLMFEPEEQYEWHGTSRARLFAHLAREHGVGRLLGVP